MAVTPNRGYTEIDPSPPKGHDIIPQIVKFQREVDLDVDGIAGGGMSNPMTALGDIIVGGTAGAPIRFAPGAGWLHNDGAGAFAWSIPTASNIGLGNVTNDAQLKIASNLSDLANAGTARTNLGVAIGSNVQAWDADLDAIAALAGTGFSVRTGANAWAQRTITGTALQIAVANGDGVSGNPTISIPSNAQLSVDTLQATSEITTVGLQATDAFVNTLVFNGTTSGQVTIQPAAIAGTWTLTLPSTAGSSAGQVLTTNGAGITSWESILSLSNPNTFTAVLTIEINNATTNAFTDLAILAHNSSGTPTTNFGGSILFKLESSTTADQDAVRVGAIWADATHATRDSAFVIQVVENGGALTESARFTLGGMTTGVIQAGTVAASSEITCGGGIAASTIFGTTFYVNGATSGQIGIQAAAVAGTWDLTLPTNDGSSGQFLMTNGSGVTSWASVSATDSNLTISNTAPSIVMTDTTASAKSLTITVDANTANFRESAGAAGSLLFLDLANNRVGIGTTASVTTGSFKDVLHLQGTNALVTTLAMTAYGQANAIVARSAEGTAASPTATALDRTLISFGGRGYNTTSGFSTVNDGTYAIKAAEAFTNTARGTYCTIETTPIGSTTRAEAVRVSDVGNVGIGATAFGTSAAKVLGIFNGTEPSTSPADMVQLYSVDLSAGNATLGLRTETSVVSETVVSDRTLSVKINGTVFKICLKA